MGHGPPGGDRQSLPFRPALPDARARTHRALDEDYVHECLRIDTEVFEVGVGDGESYTVQEVALDADTRRLMELVLGDG